MRFQSFIGDLIFFFEIQTFFFDFFLDNSKPFFDTNLFCSSTFILFLRFSERVFVSLYYHFILFKDLNILLTKFLTLFLKLELLLVLEILIFFHCKLVNYLTVSWNLLNGIRPNYFMKVILNVIFVDFKFRYTSTNRDARGGGDSKLSMGKNK